MGMHDTPRDQVLDALTAERIPSGDVEAPTGWFAAVEVDADDLDGIARDYADEIRDAGLDDLSELVGFFVVQVDSNGLLYVNEFDSAVEGLRYHSDLEAEYAEWYDMDESEV